MIERKLALGLMVGWSLVGWVFAMSITGCAATDELAETGGGGSGECINVYGPPVPADRFKPGSYDNRSFLSPANHLGDDIALSEGTPIYAIGPGNIVWYGPANGYGELVVVIEHDLGLVQRFINGLGKVTKTQKVISIYGHLRRSAIRGGTTLPLELNSHVDSQTVIGFINDGAHNGDGAAHLHFGVRLMSVHEAKQADPKAWFRGYDSGETFRGQFGIPTNALKILSNNCNPTSDTPNNSQSGDQSANSQNNDQLGLVWSSPDGSIVSQISLSGRIVGSNGSLGPWKLWQEAQNATSLSASIPLKPCETFEFSIEFKKNNQTSWSCFGTNSIIGSITGNWNSINLTAVPVSNGIGGCNLKFVAPCGSHDSTSPQNNVSQSIFCTTDNNSLNITINGATNENTLVGGNLTTIDFVSVGSNETGWQTSTTQPRYAAPFKQNSSVSIVVPASVHAFNLWVGSSAGVRWFNLNNGSWTAAGANCHLESDNQGGHLIVR